MKEKNSKKTSGGLSLIPKIARKIGEQSAGSTCFCWMCQPKVPQSMKNNK